jgi:glutathione peroxidase
MKKIVVLIFMFLSFFSKSSASYEKLAYDFQFDSIDGKIINLSEYKGKVIIIVNVASRCGFTNQYEDLQNLWNIYKDKGLVVIGVPSNNFRQEPGSNQDIKNFCETTFGINFPITEKLSVAGTDAHPFFIWAKNNYGSNAIPKWNFHKIIVGRDGKVAETFASITKPSSKRFTLAIEKEIKK